MKPLSSSGRLSELLLVKTFKPNELALKKSEYTEMRQIDKGLSTLGKRYLNAADLKLLHHNLSYILVEKFIDLKTGLLNDAGRQFVSQSTSLMREDIGILLQYFNFKSELETDDVDDANLYRERMTPYSYWRFANAFANFVSKMVDRTKNMRSVMTVVCRSILFKTDEYSRYETFAELRRNLLVVVRSTPGWNEDIVAEFKSIFHSAFRNGTMKTIPPAFMPFMNKISDRMRESVSNEVERHPEVKRMFVEAENPIMYNTLLWENCTHAGDPGWIYRSYSNAQEEMSIRDNAKMNCSYISSVAGNFGGNKPLGNIMLAIQLIGVDSERDFSVTVEYEHMKCVTTFQDKITQIILPRYKKEFDVQLRVKYTNSHDHTKSATIHVTHKEKDQKSRVWDEKIHNGMMAHITMSLVSYDREVASFLKESRFCGNLSTLFDTLCHGVVRECMWETDYIPPLEKYAFLVDMCLRYSIPTAHMYAIMTSKFIAAFNQSRQFLYAFVPVFISFKSAMDMGVYTESDKAIFDSTVEFLNKKIPQILFDQLDQPERVEKPSISALIMLLSLISGEEKAIQYFDRLVETAISNIEVSVVKGVRFLKSDKVLEGTAMQLFTMTNDPTKWENMSEDLIPYAEIDLDSLIATTKTMCTRLGALAGFYTQGAVSTLGSTDKTLASDFSALAAKMAKVFVEHDPQPDEQVILEYLSTYRRMWAFTGKVPARAPVKIFKRIIHDWLKSFEDHINDAVKEIIEPDLTISKFEITNHRKRVSSSAINLLSYLTDSIKFINTLGFEKSEVVEEVKRYVAACKRAVESYIADMLSLLLRHFPEASPAQKAMCSGAKFDNVMLTPTQIYVVMNNICSTECEWETLYKAIEVEYEVDNADCALTCNTREILLSLISIIQCRYAESIEKCMHEVFFTSEKKLWKTLTVTRNPDDRDLCRIESEVFCNIVGNEIERISILPMFLQVRAAGDLLRAIDVGILAGMAPFRRANENNNLFSIACEIVRSITTITSTNYRAKFADDDFQSIMSIYTSYRTFYLVCFFMDQLSSTDDELKELTHKDEEGFIINMIMKQRKLHARGPEDFPFRTVHGKPYFPEV